MIQRLKPKSEFNRNVLALMTGTTIAQAIPIAISPILTRIYTPEDFGVLALFVAITSIFGAISNGRYELAIISPKKDEDAINIFALGFIITCLMSLFIMTLVILFNSYFTRLLNNEEISVWLYFVPVAVFFIGLYNILNYFNIRKKYYKDIANATIIKSIITAIVQLSIGFLKDGASGLITGQLVSQMFANIRLFKNIIKDKFLISKISKVKIIALAKKYKDFPKFSMWAGLMNVLSTYLVNIFIPLFYSVATLGFYSLTQRLLGAPSTLIGESIGAVFFQEATKEKQQTGRAIKSFNSTIKKLTILGLLFFGGLFFIVEDLFAFVFGEEWRIAGVYAQIIIPLFFVRFIIGTIGIMNTVFLKNKNGLIFQLSLLCSTVIPAVISYLYTLSFDQFLFSIAYTPIIVYVIFGIYLNNLKKGV
jgi:O-antigen/teichoic acid export membrane protein